MNRPFSPWASYQKRKSAGCACAGNVSPRRRIQRKPRVSDPGMNRGTCVTHVPWCMSGLLTRGGGKKFPAFPAHAHPQFYVFVKRPMSKMPYPRDRSSFQGLGLVSVVCSLAQYSFSLLFQERSCVVLLFGMIYHTAMFYLWWFKTRSWRGNFFAFIVFCGGNPPVTTGLPSQKSKMLWCVLCCWSQ